MTLFKNIICEIKKQLTDTPSFVTASRPAFLQYVDRLKANNQQIIKGIKGKKMIFLIGPYGCGKTTQIDFFLKTNPEFSYDYKSFERIQTIEFSFLHLTSFVSRALFLFLSSTFGVFLIKFLTPIAALPISLVLIYFFVKNIPNLMYIFHEAMSNVLKQKPKLVIIEDLERSALDLKTIWVFLANLWQYKRTYLVSLGFPVDDIQEKQKIIENAMKLSGFIVDISNDERINFEIISTLDTQFIQFFDERQVNQISGWLSLFTPREMIIIHDEIQRTCRKRTQNPPDIRCVYVSTFFKYLLQKFELDPHKVSLDFETSEIKILDDRQLPPEATHYLDSFSASLKKEAKAYAVIG
jgi:hypothetical protein